MKKTAYSLGAGLALVSLSGCFGSSNRTPNEFRIVTKAPLEVPPDYNLRPPRAGSSTPAEVSQANTDRAISFGQDLGVTASTAERVLVARAGASSVNPVVRNLVDYEEAGVLRKARPVVDGVVEFVDDGETVEDTATGNGRVTIERSDGARIKLPGT
ncbi:MAG: DUF3035 domain-containing protein [Pseudomonadota bacterium]